MSSSVCSWRHSSGNTPAHKYSTVPGIQYSTINRPLYQRRSEGTEDTGGGHMWLQTEAVETDGFMIFSSGHSFPTFSLQMCGNLPVWSHGFRNQPQLSIRVSGLHIKKPRKNVRMSLQLQKQLLMCRFRLHKPGRWCWRALKAAAHLEFLSRLTDIQFI